ncbi:MAG: ABC transporter permease [Acidobacteriota bacterium]
MAPIFNSRDQECRPDSGAGTRAAHWLTGLWPDALQAVRMLRRNVAFSALAILTLALGIGLTTAMCSVLNGTLWHPLPFPDPDRLVSVRGPISYPTLSDWSAAIHSFDGLAGYRGKRYTLTGAGEATSLRATVSSGSLFSVLQAQAARGRALSPADDESGSRPVVLGDGTWRAVFAADPGILGKTIYLNRVPFVVVGVMPSGFQFPTNVDRVDLYTTIAADFQTDRRQADRTYPRDLQVIARLKPGALLAQAQAEMYTMVAAGTQEHSDRNISRTGLVVPLAAEVSGALVSPLKVLTGAITCVLVIACATVAILALIRVTARRDELAIRLALGATRAKVARQLLVENVLIALGGGAVGTLLAFLCTKPILLLYAGPNLAPVARVQFDFRVLGISLLVSLAAAAGFGTIPAVHGAATRWPHLARNAARTGRHWPASTARSLLVAAEIALTVTLVAGSISLLWAYLSLARVDPGFDPTDVLTFRIDLSDVLYTPQQQVDFFERVRTDAGRLPGVRSTAFTALLPFGDARFTIRLDVPGRGTVDGRSAGAEVHLVSQGFFRAMGIPLIEGRDFAPTDVIGHPRVGIVSHDLASRYFPGENPIGRVIDAGFGPGGAANPMLLIIGIAGNVHNGTLAAPPEPQIYVPFSQSPMIASTTFVARLSQPDPGATLSAVRQRVRALNPSIPIVNVKPLADYVHASLLQPQFNALLIGVFAAAAIFLAMTGLYAVVSYSALRRRREFSIRRALGATERRIAWLVIKQGLQAIVPGIAFGLAGALATNRMLESVLYGVRPSRPVTLLLAAVAAAAISLLATWQPARAASADDLRITLQSDT